ncbi:LysR family transcriptional regulator [Pseudothauera nasutitermitis]|uniref:LysR family transcriptional regulator n=1 Tax=Pseudothauera nasutitermitis TaxID=2565930 RepID=A0A4S4B1J5_9RHOO|nr:LysR family transcriptional regulator [Pseudothauera nasutitermitis]THF66431.1 LysR family transcriptional regulator [Pseudothauera nasutitermitis]
MRLDLADLRLFLSVVDAGSITQGAARAHLALASASERLRAIEADAGVRLLERLPRGVALTPAGEALAHHARLILRQRERMQGELREFASGLRGTVCLHANTAALSDFLPARLAPWLAARPRVDVDLRERSSAEIVQAVSAGLIEAGIVSDAVDAGSLVVRPLVEDRLVLVVPPGHARAAQRRAGFAEVLGEAFVGLAAGSALQELVEEQARRIGRVPAYRARMQTMEGLCELVAHGVGVGIVPERAACRLRRRHPLRVLRLADAWTRRRLCLCYRDWEGLSAPMRELLAHLLETADAACPPPVV